MYASRCPFSRTVTGRCFTAPPHVRKPSGWMSLDRQCFRQVCQASTIQQQQQSMQLSVGDAEVYFKDDDRPIILFDGVCNLCNGGVNFMLDWDKQGRYRFAALQSEAGKKLLQRCGRDAEDISSIVLVHHDRAYIKSDAILRIASGLQIPLPLLSALGFLAPQFFRDGFYDVIANNRYDFLGKRNACRVSDDRFASRFVSD